MPCVASAHYEYIRMYVASLAMYIYRYVARFNVASMKLARYTLKQCYVRITTAVAT